MVRCCIGARTLLRAVGAARLMHTISDMATQTFPDIHSQAAARWLAGFAPVFLFVLVMLLVMLAYPALTG